MLFSIRIISNPFLQSIAQSGARMAHISIRVCAWVYNNILPSVFARHRGHRCLPRTMEVFSHLHLDVAATKQRHAVWPGSLGPHGIPRNKRINQC